MQSIRRVLSSISITDFSFVLVSKHFFLTSGLLVKGKWQNLRDNFRRERTKISNRTTGSEAPDDSALSAWNHYKQLLFLVDVFSSRKLQTCIPSVPSQASEPADDNYQDDEYGMADDSITDADPQVSNTSGDTEEAEVVGAAQKDPPAGPKYEAL